MLQDQYPNQRLIVLVGLMGSGKTSVGREYARRRGYLFLDCDQELETRLGVSVSTIFEIEGELGFRQRETQLLDELTRKIPQETKGLVIATGGGVVLSEHNRKLLVSRALTVYLDVPVSVLLERTRYDKSRPLLRVSDPSATMSALLRQRDPLYRQVANIVVHGGKGNLKRMVNQVDHAIQHYILSHENLEC